MVRTAVFAAAARLRPAAAARTRERLGAGKGAG